MSKKINVVDKTKKKVDCSCNSDDKNCGSLALSDTEFGKAIEEIAKNLIDNKVDYWVVFKKIPQHLYGWVDIGTKYHVIEEQRDCRYDKNNKESLFSVTIVNPNFNKKLECLPWISAKNFNILMSDDIEWEIVDYKEDKKCNQEPTILGVDDVVIPFNFEKNDEGKTVRNEDPREIVEIEKNGLPHFANMISPTFHTPDKFFDDGILLNNKFMDEFSNIMNEFKEEILNKTENDVVKNSLKPVKYNVSTLYDEQYGFDDDTVEDIIKNVAVKFEVPEEYVSRIVSETKTKTIEHIAEAFINYKYMSLSAYIALNKDRFRKSGLNDEESVVAATEEWKDKYGDKLRKVKSSIPFAKQIDSYHKAVAEGRLMGDSHIVDKSRNEFPDVYSIKYPNKSHEIDKVWSYSFPICGDKVENTNSWLDSNNNEYYKLLGATSDMNVCKVWKGGDNEKKHNLVEIDLETIIECFSYIYCVLCETEDNNTVFAPNHYFSQVTGLDNHPVSEFAHISDDKIKAMLMRVLDLFDLSFLEQELRVFSRYIPFKGVPLTHVAKYLKGVMDSYNDSYGDKDYFWLNECKCFAIEYARQSDFVNEGDVIKLEVGKYEEEIFVHSSDVISEILDKQKEQHYNNVSYMKGIIKKFNDIFRSNKGFNKILHIGKSEDTVDESCDNDDVRSFNCGYSDYCKHKIQPWDIWIEYDLNPFDADIVKRVLREKHEENMTPEESRILDYEKIIHVSRERIRQLKGKLKEKQNN